MNSKQQYHFDILVEIATSRGGKVISECYERNNVKMEFECANLHHFFSTPDSVKHNRWCPQCNRVSPQEAKDRCLSLIEAKGGILITSYINTRTKIKIECSQGHQWDVTPSSLVHCNSWCPKCSKFDHQAEEELYQIVGQRGGSVKEKYVNTRTRMTFTCAKGHTWQAAPQDIKKGTWCALCSFKFDEMKEALDEIVKKRGGKVEGKYINNRTWLKFTCDKGHTWEAQVSSIKTGTWCPHCRKSIGEERIRETLERLKIPYEREFKHNLLPKRRYDFYFRYKDIDYLLEYDGEQHFRYVPFFEKTRERFNYKQDVDRLKTYLALVARYRLIRIDYTQVDNIERHLKQALLDKEQLYLATPDMYQWLLETDVSEELLYKECPDIDHYTT